MKKIILLTAFLILTSGTCLAGAKSPPPPVDWQKTALELNVKVINLTITVLQYQLLDANKSYKVYLLEKAKEKKDDLKRKLPEQGGNFGLR